jgi:hypothetical protein
MSLMLGHGTAGAIVSPSLSLSANTSASPLTPAFSNGIPAGNTEVSKVNLHTLLYAGHTTQVLMHYIPWFTGGNDSGIDVNYASSDPTYFGNFMTDAVSRGFDGIMVDWQGNESGIKANWSATYALVKNYRNINNSATMTFAVMIDENMFNDSSLSSSGNTGVVLNAMSYLAATCLLDSAYLTSGGKQVVADFGCTDPGLSGSAVNWATVQAAYPNVKFVHLDNAAGSSGFQISNSGGSFVWVQASSATANTSIANLDDFYPRAVSNSSLIAMGGVWWQFNSVPYASFDGNIYLQPQNAETWLSTWAKINTYFNSTKQLPFVQVVTWSDYYEGTAMETGIPNNLSMTASCTSRVITLTKQGAGSIDTLDHLELWAWNGSSWGQTTYSAGTTSITVSKAGTYYIKQIGKPCITNNLTGPITAT